MDKQIVLHLYKIIKGNKLFLQMYESQKDCTVVKKSDRKKMVHTVWLHEHKIIEIANNLHKSRSVVAQGRKNREKGTITKALKFFISFRHDRYVYYID